MWITIVAMARRQYFNIKRTKIYWSYRSIVIRIMITHFILVSMTIVPHVSSIYHCPPEPAGILVTVWHYYRPCDTFVTFIQPRCWYPWVWIRSRMIRARYGARALRCNWTITFKWDRCWPRKSPSHHHHHHHHRHCIKRYLYKKVDIVWMSLVTRPETWFCRTRNTWCDRRTRARVKVCKNR